MLIANPIGFTLTNQDGAVGKPLADDLQLGDVVQLQRSEEPEDFGFGVNFAVEPSRATTSSPIFAVVRESAGVGVATVKVRVEGMALVKILNALDVSYVNCALVSSVYATIDTGGEGDGLAGSADIDPAPEGNGNAKVIGIFTDPVLPSADGLFEVMFSGERGFGTVDAPISD